MQRCLDCQWLVLDGGVREELKLNEMVGDDGQWHGKVAPECVRYLPFALVDVGGDKALAAIDPRYAGQVLRSGQNTVPLYGKDGQLHEHARKRVDVLIEQQPRIRRTQDVLAKLAQAALFTPWPESVIKAGGVSIEGLHTIDEKKLAQLPDETFLALRSSGALAVAYSCLLSLYQVRTLATHSNAAKPDSDAAVQSTGDIDLEFLNESETIKFGPLQ